MAILTHTCVCGSLFPFVCPCSCVCVPSPVCVPAHVCVSLCGVCVCLCVFMCVCLLLSAPIYQEADLAVAALTLTAARELSVEMSTPFLQTGVGFILSRDLGSEESHFVSFLFPFSTEMWVGVLVAFLVTGLCIYLVAR